MKRLVLIVWVFVALLAACTSKKQVPEPVEGPSEALIAIDSLMWQRSDSALTRLLPYFDTACRDGVHSVSTAYDWHYANLLLSELLYKNDSAQTNRTELHTAVAFFDSLVGMPEGDTRSSDTRGASLQDWLLRGARRAFAKSTTQTNVFLDARAHYINGVGYYENDSAVPACKEYLKVLEIMEDHFEEKELVGDKAQFMALVYTRLTMLFSDLYLHEQAIFFGEKSLPYYQKQDAPSWHLARMLSEIGLQFEMMDNTDSAVCYYQRATCAIDDTNILIYRDIESLQIYLNYRVENDAESALIHYYNLASQAKSDFEYYARCIAIGEIYYHEQLFDSAKIYLKKVFQGSMNNGPKRQAADWLIEICKAQGAEEELQVYSDFLIPFANQEENASATKSQLTELYNTFKMSALDRQHSRVMQKSKTRAIAVLCSLLVVIFVITLLFHRNKKKLKQFESVEPDESEIQSKAWDMYTSFMEEPVCQDIIRSVQGENIKRLATPKDYPDLVLNDEQLQQLAFTVNRYFGPFEYHMEQHGVKASPIMSSLCHLFLLGIAEKQAAILLDRDYSSISRYVKKLKMAFGTQESLSVYFRNLVLNN